MTVEGNLVDVLNEKIYLGEIHIQDGKIIDIEEKEDVKDQYIIPGFVDSHIHIESTMLPPSEFAWIAVQHGTVVAVSDPHEIANVLGLEGIRYMIENGGKVPFKFYFGAPSCVPATDFETNGATIGPEKIKDLFKEDDCRFLGEMMNYPAVIDEEEEVIKKIEISKKYDRPIDRHAPDLTRENLDKYISAGISTDHECITLEKAEEKIEKGMKIQIREGSLSRKLDDFSPLLEEYPDGCMFCSDDRHPDDLIKGHINLTVKKALRRDISLMDALKVSSVNPIMHYGLDVGLL